jgi:hypothetical protein
MTTTKRTTATKTTSNGRGKTATLTIARKRVKVHHPESPSPRFSRVLRGVQSRSGWYTITDKRKPGPPRNTRAPGEFRREQLVLERIVREDAEARQRQEEEFDLNCIWAMDTTTDEIDLFIASELATIPSPRESSHTDLVDLVDLDRPGFIHV